MSPVQRLRGSLRSGRDRWLLGAAALLLAATFLDPGVTLPRALFEHVVVIDVTQSMNVADMALHGKPVSRLELARQALRAALLKLPCGSKIGWAIFTEYRSFLLLAPVEVCANLDELRATLAQIDTRMAWSGNSEVAKALHSGIGIAKALPGKPSLVFVTDGHEAPPLNPRYRPAFDDAPGEVPGLIVGVGDLRPSPIPKTDPQGRPLGFWRADEVLQTDPRSQGRGASVGGEAMVDDSAGVGTAPLPGVNPSAPPPGANSQLTPLGASPGSEHLSSLREGYLRLLAGERGMAYVRLQAAPDLADALTASVLARTVPVRTDVRADLAGVALCCVLACYAAALLGRLRLGFNVKGLKGSNTRPPGLR